jgi:hypothetical protein
MVPPVPVFAQDFRASVSGLVTNSTGIASRAGTIENRVLESVPINGRNLVSPQYTLPIAMLSHGTQDRFLFVVRSTVSAEHFSLGELKCG